MKIQTSAKIVIVKALIALATAAVIILFLYWYTGYRTVFWTHPAEGPKAVFFKERVAPILEANSSANAKAVETLKSEIHAQFEVYRQRVPAFTSDITGFSNKTQITWEATKQMASADKDKVKRHVAEKFEMHVVSAEKMQKDIERILHAFRSDIEANKNRMLVDIEVAVKNDARFSAVKLDIPDSFGKEIEAGIGEFSKQSGKDVLVLTGLNVLASVAVDYAVTELVAAALARVGTSLAASMGAAATVSGGATVAGGAGGGTTGTLGGPAGVVIGLAAGLTVGLIIDIVMTDRLETKLNAECSTFLTKAETEITTGPNGLVAALEKAVTELDKIKGAIVKKQIEALP